MLYPDEFDIYPDANLSPKEPLETDLFIKSGSEEPPICESAC
jgi:hypothetical protein